MERLFVTSVIAGRTQPMKMRAGSLLLITLFCLAATGVRNALAGTIAVTSTADDGPGSLRQTLVLASSGDTINIAAKGTITLTSGELIVDKNVTIRGPGASKLSVSGNGTNRVFHVTPNTIVTISGLTVLNGNAIGSGESGAGGGIYSDHARLTVTNCRLSGNSALYGGGIFYNARDGAGSTLVLNNSTLSNNSARYGGGIFNDGGGFFGSGVGGGANLTLVNSIVTNNTADTGGGGGIYNNGYLYGATLTLMNSTVSGNSSFFQGGFPFDAGGIHNDGELGSATLVLNNSIVSGNSGFTGGIQSNGNSGSATLTLTNSSVSGNFGSGIFSFSATATLNNSTVNNNAAGNGGGINNVNATLTLNNSALSENTAHLYGGGIFNDNGIATLNYSRVNENLAGEGGAIENFGDATLALNNSSVDGNSADTSGGGIGNHCERSGAGAIATLTDSTVSNNSHAGIFNYGFNGASATFTLINSTVSGNSGIGIYTSGVGDGSIGSLILKNSTLSNNSVRPGGGAGSIQNISLFGGIAVVELTNTIINADATGSIGSTGTVISHGYNIASDGAGGDSSTRRGGLLNGPGDIRNTDPLLGPLQNNGGPTKTHALLVNSPAIDAGDPNFSPYAFDPPLLYDQRNGPGFLRVVNGRIDIGAFESKHP